MVKPNTATPITKGTASTISDLKASSIVRNIANQNATPMAHPNNRKNGEGVKFPFAQTDAILRIPVVNRIVPPMSSEIYDLKIL